MENIKMYLIEHEIYKKLIKLIPDLKNLEEGEGMKSKSAGFMDLNLDILEINKHYLKIALSHYYKGRDGDSIPDPDMEIKVTLNLQMASALTYQDTYRYDEVFIKLDGETYHKPYLQNQLNKFLNQWLCNCLLQGHFLKKVSSSKETD